MEDERQDRQLPENGALRESVRVQKTLYMQEQLAKRRETEEKLLEQLLEEQRVIDGLQSSLDENMERTAETRDYNRELKESMERQVYALHGISEDTLTGMREYGNAYYRGCAAALFFLSSGMVVLCGVLHGFGEGITLLMLACTALQGALLAQEKKRVFFLDALCRLLYLLLFPLMLVLFVCYELGYWEYGFFLPYVSMGALALTVLGTISYFLYNPYRKERRRVRSARGQIGEIEKIAGKEVRRSRKSRIKEEKRFRKQADKDEAAALRRQERDEVAAVRQEKRREAREARRQWFARWKERLKKKRQEDEPQEQQVPEAMTAEPREALETQAPENLEMQAEPEKIPVQAEPEKISMQEEAEPVTEGL